MATAIRRRRGTATEHSTFTGMSGELTVDTTNNTLIVHDGSTVGGHRLAKYSELTGYLPLTGGTITGTITADKANINGELSANYIALTGGFRSAVTEYTQHFWAYPDSTNTNINIWKKVADITVNSGLYGALAFKATLISEDNNYGNAGTTYETVYFGHFHRSDGTLDTPNDAYLSGKDVGFHKLRIFKTATGVYELQCAATANYRACSIHIDVLGTNLGTFTTTTSITDASTTGTEYLPQDVTTNTLYYPAIETNLLDVTGTITADGYTFGALTGLNTTNSGLDLSLYHWGNISLLCDGDNNDNTRYIMLGRNSQDGGTATKIATFGESGNGDVAFYEDTGTTAKFFWDASAESLGIGTSSPTNKLEVVATSNLRRFVVTEGDGGGNYVKIGSELSDGSDGYLEIHGYTTNFYTLGGHAAVIDTAGRMGIGTTSPSSSLDVVGTITADNVSFSGTITKSGNGIALSIPDQTNVPDAPTNEKQQVIQINGNGGLYQVSGRGGLMLTSSDDALILANGDVGRGFTSSNLNAAIEDIYLLSDSNVYIKTDLQEGWGTEHTFSFTNTGTITVDGNTVWHAGNDGSGSGLDADLLDGQQGSYYRDWTNVTNKPDPTITVNGDATGSVTLTDLSNGTLTLTVSNDSHTHDGRYYTESEANTLFATKQGAELEKYITFNDYDDNAGANTGLRTYVRDGIWYINGDTSAPANIEVRINGNKVFHAGNDGSGSGLDADTLDGYNHDQFVKTFGAGNTGVTELGRYIDLHTTGSTADYDMRLDCESATVLNIVGGTLEIGGYRAYATNYHPEADKWTTARTLTLNGDATGSVSIDGSSNQTLTVTVFGNSHTHEANTIKGLQAIDTRAAARVPNDYVEKSLTAEFTDDFPVFGAWGSALTVKGWTDGYNAWQIIGNGSSNTTIQDLYYRHGTTTAWTGMAKIWSNANDGSGSGLDADLLDGVQGSSFLRSDTSDTFGGGLLAVTVNSGSDISSAGTVNTLELRQNGAAGGAFLTFHNAGRYAVHFGLDYTNNDLYVGGYSMGTNKYKIWHAGNDGSGSGLDADTLDGQHGSYYQNASNLNAGTISDARLPATITSSITGNAATATKLATARSIALSGDVSGSTTFDGSGNVTITATVANNSHDHTDKVDHIATANNITSRVDGGFYETSTATTAEGWPTTTNAWYHLMAATHSNTTNYYSMQIAGTFYDQEFYGRKTNNSGTQTWCKFWTDTNDGSGSGLDADTVDGLQASAFMRATSANGYYGLTTPGNNSSDWIRTTINGLIPYNSGGASSLGTSSWPFNAIYGNNIYDGGTLLENKYLGINAKAADSDKLDNLDSSQFLRSDAYDVQSGRIRFSSGFDVGDNGNVYLYKSNTTANNFTIRTGSSAAWRYYTFFGDKNELQIAGQKAWYAGNDGSGSGLDADTVDGLQASQFLRADADDTTTGNLTANGHMRSDHFRGRSGNGLLITGGDCHDLISPGTTEQVWIAAEAGVKIYASSNNLTSGLNRSTTLIDTSGNMSVGGIVTATDFIATSDRRVKENLENIEDSLNKVNKLTGYTYDQIEIGERKAGIIAQDLQEVLPEGVTEDEDGKLSVSPMAVIGLLVEAVKEQKQKFEDQQKEIDELKLLVQKLMEK